MKNRSELIKKDSFGRFFCVFSLNYTIMGKLPHSSVILRFYTYQKREEARS
jgi:hypothetical protein